MSRLKQWIEALRSGEYQQGIGALNQNGRYCCLGVLAEISPDFFEKDTRQTYTGCSLYNLIHGKERFVTDLPYKFLQEVFPSKDTQQVQRLMSRLISMNDSEGKSFSAIADYLESLIA